MLMERGVCTNIDPTFEDNFEDALSLALNYHKMTVDDLNLRLAIEVPASHWIGNKLCMNQLGLQEGLRCWRRLADARGNVIRGGMHSLLGSLPPVELESIWQRLRRAYLDLLAETNSPQECN